MPSNDERKRGRTERGGSDEHPPTSFSPLVAAALESGSNTLRARVERIARHSAGPGRYTLLGEIARGGMGRILRVWDEVLDRELAMKVVTLSPKRVQDADDPREVWPLERFIEEARITGQLEHPGIVPIYDIGLDERGALFFTMPRVRGETLKRVFKLSRNRLGGWTLHRVLGVIHKVCQTVAYAHEAGVVHRDLKPDNVMVGRLGELYVMDWGLALILGRRERGSVVGTPAYMAPEQATGRLQDVGPASDVYSVGALLYELLSGRMPHEVSLELRDRPDDGRNLLEVPPRPVGQVVPRAPAELVAICEKAMAERIQDRYPSMQALADDLQAWLEGRVVDAYDTRLPTRWKKWRARNKPLALALDLMVLIVLGSCLAIFAQQRTSLNEVRAEQRITEQQTYAANIAAADLGLRAHETADALRRLQMCEPQLRGWEWEHLMQRADASRLVLEGHEQEVGSIAVSPYGDLVATGSDDETVRLWRFSDGSEAGVLAGHTDVVTRVAFRRNRDQPVLLASASQDATVRLWNVAEKTLQRTIREFADDVLALAFSPDGAHLAAADHRGVVVVWDLYEGEVSASFTAPDDRISELAFDPRTGGIVTLTTDGRLELWDIDGERLASVRVGTSQPRALAVDARGERFAFGLGKTIRIVDAATLEVLTVLAGHTNRVSSLAFAPKGNGLVSGGFDNVLFLWDLEREAPRLAFDGHHSDVSDVAFHPNGRSILSASEDGTARIWDVEGKATRLLEELDRPRWTSALAFARDGRLYTAGARHPLNSRSFNGRTVTSYKGADSVDCMAVSSAGTIAFGRGTNALRFGPIHTPSAWIDLPLGGEKGFPRAVAFDAAGERVFVRDSEDAVVCFDTRTRERLLRIDDQDPDAFSLAVHPSGRWFAVGDGWGNVRVISTETSATVSEACFEPEDGVEALAFSPDGTELAAGTRGSAIHLVAFDAGELGAIRTLSGHEKLVTTLSFSPDGSRLVSGSRDLTVRLWDTREGTLVLTLRGHTGAITAAAFDPKGEHLVSAAADGTLRAWLGGPPAPPRAAPKIEHKP